MVMEPKILVNWVFWRWYRWWWRQKVFLLFWELPWASYCLISPWMGQDSKALIWCKTRSAWEIAMGKKHLEHRNSASSSLSCYPSHFLLSNSGTAPIRFRHSTFAWEATSTSTWSIVKLHPPEGLPTSLNTYGFSSFCLPTQLHDYLVQAGASVYWNPWSACYFSLDAKPSEGTQCLFSVASPCFY